jgi:hypothetical protein
MRAVADLPFNPDRGEAFRMLLAGTFNELDATSRATLGDWLASASNGSGAGRIDTVLDLSRRPWNVADARTIIGVFEPGQGSASWLLVGHVGHVGHRAAWTLVRCEDGFVSETRPTLGEILGLIDDALRG